MYSWLILPVVPEGLLFTTFCRFFSNQLLRAATAHISVGFQLGLPFPCEYSLCIPGFCQLLAHMKTLPLTPRQLLYELLLKDFPNAFWKSSWLYQLGFASLLTLACRCFKRTLTDMWVMTAEASCDEYIIFIHISTPPIPSDSFFTLTVEWGEKWVPR